MHKRKITLQPAFFSEAGPPATWLLAVPAEGPSSARNGPWRHHHVRRRWPDSCSGGYCCAVAQQTGEGARLLRMAVEEVLPSSFG
jgi:hypothetical protein